MGNVFHAVFGTIGHSIFYSVIGLQADSGVLFETPFAFLTPLFWFLPIN